MGTSFEKIYSQAITELKDPDIKKLLNEMPILFSQVMYNFLSNAIPLFNTPLQVKKRLYNKKLPYEILDNIVGDGANTKFKILQPISSDDLDNFLLICRNESVDIECYFDISDMTINFYTPPLSGEIIEYQLYYIGSFEVELYSEEIYILSQLLLSCWTEYITNDKLDNIRLLGDTDFKLPANANTLLSKINWNIVNRETATKRMKNYAWDATMLGIYK